MRDDELIAAWISYDDYGGIYYISAEPDKSGKPVQLRRSQIDRLKEIKKLHQEACLFVVKTIGDKVKDLYGVRPDTEPQPDEQCLFGTDESLTTCVIDPSTAMAAALVALFSII